MFVGVVIISSHKYHYFRLFETRRKHRPQHVRTKNTVSIESLGNKSYISLQLLLVKKIFLTIHILMSVARHLIEFSNCLV